MDYSQNGEQQIIDKFFLNEGKECTRYLVDVGAYDGIEGSNSRFLLLRGWSGLLIEPNPLCFERLKSLYDSRLEIKCVQAAISDYMGESIDMRFSIGPPGLRKEDQWKYAQVSTLNDDFANYYEEKLGYIYEKHPVNVLTLNSILASVSAPTSIGFMTIDCEGEDLKIIKSFYFDRYKPKLLCIECNDESRHQFTNILEKFGYVFFDKTECNTFYSL